MGKIYCNNCSKKCVGDVLKVGEKYFHQGCFNCKDCGVTLDAGGFYFRNENYYCPVDYTSRFTNKCFICQNIISSEVVSALNHHFHKECFRCNECNNIFVPGNRVTMKNDKFLCTSCSAESDTSSKVKKNPATTPNSIFNKTGDHVVHKDVLSDDTVTDQGYISADPTSLSSPTQVEEYDLKTQSCKESFKRSSKSSSATRSLFDFGKFYKSSYLDMQEKQQKERQSQPKRYSSRSFAKNLFSGNVRQSCSTKRHGKSQNSDMLSLLSRNKLLNKPIVSTSESYDNEKENIIRLSSYPSGEKYPDDIQYPIERDDWPAPLSSSVLLLEKKQRKQKFFGNSVQSELDQVDTDNVLDHTQSLDHLAMSKSRQRSLLEVLNTSKNHTNSHTYNQDVISASRSPSASIEPVSKQRYSNHIDKSKSRDSSYFNNPDRHLGYSLDFISSTNRPFLVGTAPYNMYGKSANKLPIQPLDKLKPGYTKGLVHNYKISSLLRKQNSGDQNCSSNNNNEMNNQNSISNTAYSWTANRTMSDTFDVQLKSSEYDLTFDGGVFDNVDELASSEIDLVTGLKNTRNKYSKDRIKDQTLTSGRSSINSRIESLETWSFWSHKPVMGVRSATIAYSDLVSKDEKTLRYLDIHKLETYLSADEFQNLFKLNRSEFYRLPEWKQNDLKRRINLF